MWEPYATLINTIIKCDNLLERFYKDHSKAPSRTQELKAAGFSFNAILSSSMYGPHTYYLTGRFRWEFVDDSQQQVYIRKRD